MIDHDTELARPSTCMSTESMDDAVLIYCRFRVAQEGLPLLDARTVACAWLVYDVSDRSTRRAGRVGMVGTVASCGRRVSSLLRCAC